MGYIYKIWNEDNNKLYIGQTSVGIKTRWSQHLSNYLTNNAVLYRAMRKHGAGIFHIEQIEECENDMLNEREKYWISYYDSYKNGYNSTPGGTALPSGKMFKRLDDSLIRELWDNGLSITEISEKTQNSTTSIREHLLEYENFNIEESIKRGNIKSGISRRKSITQWDLQGNFIAKYESASEASKITGIPDSNIGKCLHKERQTAGDFYWTYENEIPIIKTITQIYQYDKDNNLIAIYKTKAEAARALNLDSGSITKVCKGQRKTCGGFKWEEK